MRARTVATELAVAVHPRVGALGDPPLADLHRRGHALTGDLAVQTQPVEERTGDARVITGVQVHGAMGFSSEADPHRFVKRAQVLSRLGPPGRRLDDLLLAGTA